MVPTKAIGPNSSISSGVATMQLHPWAGLARKSIEAARNIKGKSFRMVF
jgi:hypothetical protein